MKSALESFATAIGTVVLAVGGIVGFSLLMAFPTKWVVNAVFNHTALFYVFGTPTISVWKAWGINFLFSGSIKTSK